MALWKKVLLGIAAVVVLLVGLFVLLVGPWPTYASTDYQNASYYKSALATIDRTAAQGQPATPQGLSAGWAKANITPPVGTPLAGFGDRKGKPSTGVHDECFVKALALSDGADTVVIIGSDMLIIPENLADAVRAEVTSKTTLKPEHILFNSSHDHSGPGAWGPGFAGTQIAGKYDEKILTLLKDAFVEAVVSAYDKMEPASLGYGSVSVPEYIRNRTREARVDSTLGYILVEQDDKDKCVVARYSAHPTNLGGSNMEFTGEYPGALQRAVEEQTGAFAMYLGGALGSMGPKAPEGTQGFAKAEAMGRALAGKVLEKLPEVKLEKQVEIGFAGGSIGVPPLQLCVNRKMRLSPFVFRMIGVDNDAWIHGIRIGNLYLVGTPSDFSGELSMDLHEWARPQGRELWMLGFNGDYMGYISPDQYYLEPDDDGGMGYETQFMSWCGPNGGSYFEDLTKHVVETLATGGA
ncbi:MAG: neutral/alkaline non-lysosomal ceramidase N-terminal domain-containing protein [FCB group bacterium]|jgi:hypothetical protein|nr:neutral/alkaline non-lysosomal ceramidase N-terminal domain-containing protein [FCB group bacterium]